MASAGDAAAVLDVYRPIVLRTAVSFEWEPPSVEEVARRIDDTLERFPWIVAERPSPGGGVAGYASASRYRTRKAYDWSAEVSVYVAADARRRRVATALYNALHRVLHLQGIHVTYAGIALPNPASEELHRRAGFERIGILPDAGYKFGRWHDVLWLRRELTPATGEPGPFVPLPELEERAVTEILGR